MLLLLLKQFQRKYLYLLFEPNANLSICLDIEDLDNWHGKPIPKDRVDDLLNDLKAQIQVPNKTLIPELPKEDLEQLVLSNICLPSLPTYKKGDKVSVDTVDSMCSCCLTCRILCQVG